MNLIACIKQIVKERGIEEIAKPTFLGLLCDYGAFEEESNEAAIKHILKLWLGNGKMEKISKMSASDSQWKIDVSDIIHQTETEGFKKEVASDLLHKLLLGIGIVGSSFDWDKEFITRKTINIPQSIKQQKIYYNEWEKIEHQKQIEREAYFREKETKEKIEAEREKREKRRETRAKVLWGITIGMSALLLVSVIVYCYCRIVDSGHELVWGTLSLVSIVVGMVTSIVAGILDYDIERVLWGITIGMSALLLVSVIVYCYCRIVDSGNEMVWGTLSLVSIVVGMVTAIIAGVLDGVIGEVFLGITGLMAAIFIVSLIVIIIGWIAGTGHKEIWNLLCLISLCTGIVSYILGLVFDD